MRFAFLPSCIKLNGTLACFQLEHPFNVLSIFYPILFQNPNKNIVSFYVIDLFMMGFDDILIRVGLAILHLLREDLLRRSLEELQTSLF